MAWDVHSLFRRHAQGISRSLRKRGLDAETAADLTQDTFLRVLTSPPAEQAFNYNPEAYLHRVARNLVIDHIRRERRAANISLSDLDFTRIVDPSPSAETVVYAREKLALVARTLAELPERQQKAFFLHRMAGMTTAQVGGALGISTSGAWNLIRDAYEHIDARMSGL